MGNIISGQEKKTATNTSKIDTGDYIGYTRGESDQKPTLYFEKGHYTQQYDNDFDNIGWHPVRSEQHVMANYNYQAKDDDDSASEDGMDPGNDNKDLVIIRDGGQNRLQIKNDLDGLIKRKKWAAKLAPVEAHFLIEYDSIEGEVRNSHKSRGKLMVYGKEGGDFDKEFGPGYATKVMKNAKLADNEKKEQHKNEKSSDQNPGPTSV